MLVMRIPEEDDLYSPYAPEGNQLNEDALDYLKNACNEMTDEQRGEKHLEILCGAPLDEQRARAAFQKTFDQEIATCDRLIKFNKDRALHQYLRGAVLIILGIVLSSLTDQFFLEFISILGGFAIENGADIQFNDVAELRDEKKMLETIRTWKISFLTA